MVVIEQPKKAIVSLIVVDSIPNNSIHIKFEELRKISDLIFIFRTKEIDYDKFTTLYQGCGYIMDNKKSTVELMKFSMEYCLEIFKLHTAFLICPNLETLGYPEINYETLVANCISGVSVPIMISRRLDNDEFQKIYTPSYKIFKNWKDDFWKYSSHVSISPIILLKSTMVRTILELSEGIVETFLNSPSHWIASIIERNGIEHINKNPYDIL